MKTLGGSAESRVSINCIRNMPAHQIEGNQLRVVSSDTEAFRVENTTGTRASPICKPSSSLARVSIEY